MYANKKEVYFVRHGQSIDNSSPVFQSVDSPLSEKGIRQAKSIADRLSKISFEALISSPLARAKQTAEYIAERTKKDIVFSDLFVERIKPSSVDGKPFTDEEASTTFRAWERTLFIPGDNHIEDGENFDDINSRAQKALAFLFDRPESILAVVTHGYFMRAILASVLVGDNITGEIMKQFQSRAEMENTGIAVLQYKDAFGESEAWRLWTYNDHSHFAE